MYIDNHFLNQVTSADTTLAAEVDSGTLKNWVSRKDPPILLLPEERIQARLLFSINRVVQIALTQKFVSLGVQPKRAGLYAAGFTDVGKPSRMPGQIYRNAYTWLAAGAGAETARVIKVGVETPAVLIPHYVQGDAALIVDVTATVHRVRVALGLPEWPTEQSGGLANPALESADGGFVE